MAITYLDQVPTSSKITYLDEEYRPSLLEKASESIQNNMGGVKRAMDITGNIQDLTFPPLALSRKAFSQASEGLDTLGGQLSEALGKKGANPYLAGAAGMIAANAPFLVGPELPGMAGKILGPKVGPGMAEGVSAARQIGVPLRRGEVSGGKFSSGISNLMEKTAMGAGPEDAFSARQKTALETERAKLQGKLGSSADVYSAGAKAKQNIAKRGTEMVSKRDSMFDQIPDNVNIPLSEYQKIGDQIVQEQSRVRPIARDADVGKFASDAQNPYGSTGQGVTGGPDKFGERISVSPEEKFSPKSNYFDVKAVRETLNARIAEAHDAGNFTKERQFLRLKSALDKDIENFASSPATPLDSMMAKEFKQTYRKANAFSGAYRGLFKSDEAMSLMDAPPERIVDIVFKRNNETAIKRFRALVGEDGFLPSKKKFTQEIIDSPNVKKELDKYEPGTLLSIYSGPELAELRRYAAAQDITKTTSRLQGTSGSARSNIAAGQYTGLGAGIVSLLTGNIPGAIFGLGQFAAPAAISRANLALAEGIPTSFGKASTGVSRLSVPLTSKNKKRSLSDVLGKKR